MYASIYVFIYLFRADSHISLTWILVSLPSYGNLNLPTLSGPVFREHNFLCPHKSQVENSPSNIQYVSEESNIQMTKEHITAGIN